MAEYLVEGTARAGARNAIGLRRCSTDGARGGRRGVDATRAGSGAVPRDDQAVRRRRLHARLHPPDRRQPGRVRRVRATGAGAEAMSNGESENPVPQPEDIYERTKEEGRRRLERPVAEEISTALAAGFDIVAGIIALAL